MANNSIASNSMANRFGWTFPFFRKEPAIQVIPAPLSCLSHLDTLRQEH